MIMDLQEVFQSSKPVVAMVHVEALPGTPLFKGSVDAIVDKAVQEARLYRKAGVTAIGIENMHDVPYLRGQVGPEVTAAMTRVATAVKQASGLPCGVQVLAGANREAMAVALAAGLDFIRAEGFVFAHVADEGIIQSSAGDLLRYRRQIGADHIAVLTDIKKKHSAHQITADVDIVETAEAAKFFLSDGVILTGSATGKSADPEEIRQIKAKVSIPVWMGSGITVDNIETYWEADGWIVGSHFKENGQWSNPLSYERVARFMEKISGLS